MGFTSDGKGCGCTFYFELPLYSRRPEVLPEDACLHTNIALREESDRSIDINVSDSSKKFRSLSLFSLGHIKSVHNDNTSEMKSTAGTEGMV